MTKKNFENFYSEIVKSKLVMATPSSSTTVAMDGSIVRIATSKKVCMVVSTEKDHIDKSADYYRGLTFQKRQQEEEATKAGREEDRDQAMVTKSELEEEETVKAIRDGNK